MVNLDKLQIQPMQADHLSSVLEIENVSFPTPWSYRSYMGELTRNNFAHYFVGLIEDKVVGYIGIWIVLDEAHITTIAVAPEFRGNHIAERFIEFGVEYSKVWGAEKMLLEVRVSNKAAQKVYKRMGFVEIGVRKQYYSDTLEDAIVMLKRYDDLTDIKERID
ncbi:MAG TPA: ribosomal protein S18-alanine N-acetyltransferase [Clostridia bacterium]|nr:ribosomal protein S18-alanine N-acetyltransferase [Clostridia bacterium]